MMDQATRSTLLKLCTERVVTHGKLNIGGSHQLPQAFSKAEKHAQQCFSMSNKVSWRTFPIPRSTSIKLAISLPACPWKVFTFQTPPPSDEKARLPGKGACLPFPEAGPKHGGLLLDTKSKFAKTLANPTLKVWITAFGCVFCPLVTRR